MAQPLGSKKLLPSCVTALAITVTTGLLLAQPLFAASVADRHAVTLRLVDPVQVGAIRYEVRFEADAGEFANDEGAVQCQNLLSPPTKMTFQYDPESHSLQSGIFSLVGFQGPVDLAVCVFEGRSGRALRPEDFHISVNLVSAMTRERMGSFPKVEVGSITPAWATDKPGVAL